MKSPIDSLKSQIIELSKDIRFIHHPWFVKYHLAIVEKISSELCEIYADSDKDLVQTMVWLHDYGKILNYDKQYEMTQKSGLEFLLKLGFDEKFAIKALEYIQMVDSKLTLDLKKAPIEVKIVSSADGAAHLVGPFFAVYLQEFHEKPLADLMAGNIHKAITDWERKIVLPEVKRAFEARHKLILEQNGEIPEKFLNQN